MTRTGREKSTFTSYWKRASKDEKNGNGVEIKSRDRRMTLRRRNTYTSFSDIGRKEKRMSINIDIIRGS